MLRSLYNLSLNNRRTATPSRLLWGKLRQRCFGADPYWDVLDLMKKYDVRHFLDIGMHRGIYTDMVLRVLPAASISGFEPTPESFSSLSAKYASIPKVRLYNYALSDRNGQAPLYCNANEQTNSLHDRDIDADLMGKWMDGGASVNVDLIRLDEIEHLATSHESMFAKIDVQGAEEEVIAGGLQLSSERIMGCLIEVQLRQIYKTQGRLIQIVQQLNDLGFEIRQIYPAMVIDDVAVQVELLFCRKRKL